MSYFNVFLSENLFSEVLVEEPSFFLFFFSPSPVCFSLCLFVIGNTSSTAFSLQLSFCQASSVLIYSFWKTLSFPTVSLQGLTGTPYCCQAAHTQNLGLFPRLHTSVCLFFSRPIARKGSFCQFLLFSLYFRQRNAKLCKVCLICTYVHLLLDNKIGSAYSFTSIFSPLNWSMCSKVIFQLQEQPSRKINKRTNK